MSAKPTKAPSTPQADTVQPETPARARPKLSLHYGTRTSEERK